MAAAQISFALSLGARRVSGGTHRTRKAAEYVHWPRCKSNTGTYTLPGRHRGGTIHYSADSVDSRARSRPISGYVCHASQFKVDLTDEACQHCRSIGQSEANPDRPLPVDESPYEARGTVSFVAGSGDDTDFELDESTQIAWHFKEESHLGGSEQRSAGRAAYALSPKLCKKFCTCSLESASWAPTSEQDHRGNRRLRRAAVVVAVAAIVAVVGAVGRAIVVLVVVVAAAAALAGGNRRRRCGRRRRPRRRRRRSRPRRSRRSRRRCRRRPPSRRGRLRRTGGASTAAGPWSGGGRAGARLGPGGGHLWAVPWEGRGLQVRSTGPGFGRVTK